MSLVVGDGRLFFLDVSARLYELVALDLTDGRQVWRASTQALLPGKPEDMITTNTRLKDLYIKNMEKGRLEKISICFYQKDMLVLGEINGIHAISAKDGHHLWSSEKLEHISPSYWTHKEAYFTQGLVWSYPGPCGFDPITGEIKKKMKRNTGSRCQRYTATERYLINGREFAVVPWNGDQLDGRLICFGKRQ